MQDLISIFNDAELELLVCGLPEIDTDDLRANTEYTGYTPSSPVVQYFWEVRPPACPALPEHRPSLRWSLQRMASEAESSVCRHVYTTSTSCASVQWQAR